MNAYPEWLNVLAWASIASCSLSAVWIAIDFLRGRQQKMWIMYVVWPVTAMYLGPIAIWLYRRTRDVSGPSTPNSSAQSRQFMQDQAPTREQVAVSVFHCGAGCTLGDVIGEIGLFAVGGVLATAVGGSDFATKLLVDFALAYILGIFFQYFTIVPMRGLSPGKGIVTAMRADSISIASFEIGMFAWMAIARYAPFPEPDGIHPNTAVFWFMMQIAMVLGGATSYPANAWLLRKGWKEKMPEYPSKQVMRDHQLPKAA